MDFESRHFLFLQGPHGPFFKRLALILAGAGANVRRIGFNGGDRYFWDQSLAFEPCPVAHDEWPKFINEYLKAEAITDLVLYGDTRAIHAEAIKAARAAGITIHCFEEGYLRPYWLTYERGGVNGHSELMGMDVDGIREKRKTRHVDLVQAPAQWGSLLHHNWYGFVYHFFLAVRARHFPNYRRHRSIGVGRELELNARRLLTWPWTRTLRDYYTRRFLNSGYPFYVVLLQLDHDASLRFHSHYESQREFIGEVIEAFAEAAPPHIRLVFKLHPLDDGRVPLRAWIREEARGCGVRERVVSFAGGELGHLISHARAALSVNSTSVQQLMYRGIPVRLSGVSVFSKPEFASPQSYKEFFASPQKPDRDSFLEYRSYLLETSQIAGGFYTVSGRAEALRAVVDLMMAPGHPYEE